MNKKYTGKMFDAMIQIDTSEDIEKILDDNTQWVDKFCVFYRNKFDKKILSDKVILGTTKRTDQKEDISIDYRNDILSEIKEHNCKFIGELMLSHADKVEGDINTNFERYINPQSAILSSLIQRVFLPTIIHWEVYNTERDLANIKNMLFNNQSRTFIWAHCGFANPDLIDSMLSEHTNLVATLSKLELIRTSDSWISAKKEDLGGYNVVHKEYLDKLNTGLVDQEGNIKSDWKLLLEKHSDRFMFATDCHKPHRFEKYNTIVSIWRDILGSFEADIAEKIAYKNASRVYGIYDDTNRIL
jgi:hypothetical protein